MAKFDWHDNLWRENKEHWEFDGTDWQKAKGIWEFDGTAWIDVTPYIEVNISTSTNGLDLKSYLTTNSEWNGTTVEEFIVTITSGTIISGGANQYALTIENFPVGTEITINIESGAYVVGFGGDGARYTTTGGQDSGYTGLDGGHAIKTDQAISINNLGTVAGGGGGGGGAPTGRYRYWVPPYDDGKASHPGRWEEDEVQGGPGGGGAGSDVGQPGAKGSQTSAASVGTLTSGGNGGNGHYSVANGGKGGNLGENGSNSSGTSWGSAHGVGGLAGYSVDGYSMVTWINVGTLLGRTNN